MIIVTPVALVLKTLVDQIDTKVTNMKKVYNPELAYEDGIKLLKGDTDFKDVVSDTGKTPIFMFNRSALKRDESVGQRMRKSPVEKDIVTGIAREFKSNFLEFEFRFLYVTPSLRNLEIFEMGYTIGDGVKDIKDFTVDLTDFDIGNFSYQVNWKQLEDIQVNVENTFYKAIGSSATIKGNFLIAQGTTKIIQEINFLVKDWLDVTLDTFQIVPA